jgi:2-iminobutanoate/2-iminopropanoate deaminase
MAKQRLAPEGMAKPSGPFSSGTRSGRFVFVAGQVAVDGEGKTVGVGDIGAQTRQVLTNIGKVLQAGGATFDDVVKVTVFVTDLDDLSALQAVRPEFFSEPYPASTLVKVAQLINPDWLVEIEAIAIVDE